MKIKVSEATPLQLDYMVGCALGLVAKLHGVIPFSTDWSQGGPIIEREGINIIQSGSWFAEMDADHSGGVIYAEGDTPLIAAMRCYVASKLGDEVEIPAELLNQGATV
jgi:hypothetical protein